MVDTPRCLDSPPATELPVVGPWESRRILPCGQIRQRGQAKEGRKGAPPDDGREALPRCGRPSGSLR